MSDTLPPRGGAVAMDHDPVADFFARRKDWVSMLNRVVRPALMGGIGAAFVLMTLLVGLAFGIAAMRSAFALPVGDMSLGFAPLATALLPVVLHQFTRSQEKRAGVAG